MFTKNEDADVVFVKKNNAKQYVNSYHYKLFVEFSNYLTLFLPVCLFLSLSL